MKTDELAGWVAIPAPSGREARLRDAVVRELEAFGARPETLPGGTGGQSETNASGGANVPGEQGRPGESRGLRWRIDPLGNLIVPPVHGPREGVLTLAAPLDEPGVVVTHIDEEGYLRFDLVGNLEPSEINGRLVLLQGQTGDCFGLIAVDRRLRQRGRGNAGNSGQVAGELRAEELFIDIGAPSRAEAEKQVTVGSAGVLWWAGTWGDAPGGAGEGTRGVLIRMGSGPDRLAGRALGRRSLAYLLFDLIRSSAAPPAVSPAASPVSPATAAARPAAFVFTVQSLLGGRGIQTAAFRLEPDPLIVLMPVAAQDWPAADPGEVKLGGGPVLVLKEGPGTSDRDLVARLEAVAGSAGVPLQRHVATGRMANDLSQGAWAGRGTRALGLGLPVRAAAGGGPEIIATADWTALRELLLRLLGEGIDHEQRG